jgi:tRNA(His) 5'-end guanylyltransferase
MSKTNPTETLGDRMKAFEAITTSTTLMPHTPVYARIDGRAFHTFCRGFEKPFSRSFVMAMQETCKELVEKTGAIVGFVQSDEISLGWEDYTKAPFNGRLFKLQSVLASIASTAFVMHVMQTKSAGDKLYDATVKYHPTFDCRVCNVPNMHELSMQFLFRSNDAVKNSCISMAQSFFTHRELQSVDCAGMIDMMNSRANYDFYNDTPDFFKYGTFYHRVLVNKIIPTEILAKIKNTNNLKYDKNGHAYCLRKEIQPIDMHGMALNEMSNKEGVLFYGEIPERLQ